MRPTGRSTVFPLIAAGLEGLALTYPVLRTANLVPTEALLSLVSDESTERTGSLAYRFQNEAVLLENANTKPAFGWGT